MSHKNLTYSVRGIFTECLLANRADRYLIAAYQRGYKWESSDSNDESGILATGATKEVDKLLADLWRQFEAQARSTVPLEYYLQFLTLKTREKGGLKNVLEVIDGQQRLTTLSVLFAVLRHVVEDPQDKLNFAFTEQESTWPNGETGKLEYGVRERFLDNFIYRGNIDRLLSVNTWDQFLEAKFPGLPVDFDRNQQDIYYLFKAARRMMGFLTHSSRKARAAAFGKYVADCGRLIANVIEEQISSEELFSNLNSNRKPLTDIELIKGLLLTRATRQGGIRTFQEIQELRSAQGRQWDEIARWVNQASVRVLYGFKQKTVLWEVLHLVALRLTASDLALHQAVQELVPQENKFPLFDLFEQLIRQGNEDTSANRCLKELRLIISLLQDWYNTPELHNMLGVLRTSKSYSAKRKHALLPALLSERCLIKGPRQYLREQINLLSCLRGSKVVESLSYNDQGQAAFDFLLLLNVYPARADKNVSAQKTYPFDFLRFSRERWSLEHIYPQRPDLVSDPDGYERQLLRAFEGPDAQLKTERLGLLAVIHPDEEQVAQLHEWHQEQTVLLHSVGNLALLATRDNSSFSNLSFESKRQRLINRVREGSFVPTHTFAVFSKLVLAASKQFDQWSRMDIQHHAEYLQLEHARLIKHFTNSDV